MKRAIPVLLILISGAVALGGTAHADVLMGPPQDCPSGSRGASSHVGPTCAPVRCESDIDCTEGSGCVSASRCVVERAQIGGWASGSVHPDMLRPAEDGSCAEGSCEQARFCMPAAVEEATKDHCGERSALPVKEPKNIPGPAKVRIEEAEKEDSGCASATAGVSAGLAGLLGLVALGRRRP